LIDVDGDGLCATSVEAGVEFTFMPRAVPVRTAWTCGPTPDALVGRDLTRDGRIDGAWELVGGRSGPANGLMSLRRYDGARRTGRGFVAGISDSVLDSRDDIYRFLVLWTDRNHNGRSEEPELESLENAGVTSIDLASRPVSDRDKFGNVITARSMARVRRRGRSFEREVVTVRFADRAIFNTGR
jgi:hypothetical protein